ncbi:MAG: hypothetical protein JWO39_899 [Gemmatimonadetes bacterium]|nr:hypothetical protein [Gemmatimonadota bacterium]
MPTSYRMYVERRKAVEEDCEYTEQQYVQAIARRADALADMDTAEGNLDRGSAELRGERESDLLESTARLNAAAVEVNVATEERDRAHGEREDLKNEYPGFEADFKKGISPSDERAPADVTTRRERIGELMDQTKSVIDTGIMTGGMIAKIVTATPDVHEQTPPPATIQQIKQEVSTQAISLDGHTTQVYNVRVSATPGQEPPEVIEKESTKERNEEREKERQKELEEGRETEEQKRYVESQVEAIGEQEHMTGADGLKEKNNELLKDMAESSKHSSFPEPEKSAELIAAQSRTVANDNDPSHDGTSPRTPANDNTPEHREMPAADKPLAMPAHAATAGGMPNPDPPAHALAAQTPANDNKPRSPANDNDPNF